MNELILIKNGPYTGHRAMAERVLAQDGLRYRCLINGKIIGFRPVDVNILPDTHPLYKREKEMQKPITTPTPEMIDKALREVVEAIAGAKIQPEPVNENPAPEVLKEQITEPKRCGRPKKVIQKAIPAPAPPEPVLPDFDKTKMDIVIDFDGTVVAHAFPKIGKDIGAVPVLRELVENGHRLILFTMRSDIDEPIIQGGQITAGIGKHLSRAVEWFSENGIPLYGVQANPRQESWTKSHKAYGQIIIDDAALGCPLRYDQRKSHRPFVDWVRVRQILVDKRLIRKKESKIF